jgi:uncharacterized protein (TIGR02594 family)
MATSQAQRDMIRGVLPKYSRAIKVANDNFGGPVRTKLNKSDALVRNVAESQEKIQKLYPEFFGKVTQTIGTLANETDLTMRKIQNQQKEFQEAVIAKLTGRKQATRAGGSRTRTSVPKAGSRPSSSRPASGSSTANSGTMARTARQARRNAESGGTTGSTPSRGGNTRYRDGARGAEVRSRAGKIARGRFASKVTNALVIGGGLAAGAGGVILANRLSNNTNQRQTGSGGRTQTGGGISQPQLKGSASEREQAVLKAAKDAGITDKTELSQFMAQWAHESGNFKHMQEIWGPTAAQSRYEGRRDLGNTQTGDGYRYRGRGFSQLTGRANYRTIGNKIGADLENNPDLASQPDIAAKIAIEYWKTRVKTKVSNFEDTRSVTYYINGGYNGLDDRISKFQNYKNRDLSVTQKTNVPATDASGKTQTADPKGAATTTGTAGAPPAGSATAAKFAQSVLGLHETTNNQQLVDYMKAGGVSINPAKTAWCAAFVNASLGRAGIKGTGSLAAGSFSTWGTAVSKPQDVQAGDVVVNRVRSPRTGLIGSHVMLATGPASNKNGRWSIPTIGGNESSSVKSNNKDFEKHIVRRTNSSNLISGFTPQALPSAPGTPTPAASSLSKESNVPVTDSSGTTGTATGTSSGYTSPVDGARISSKFGYRIHPIKKTRRMHTGVDYAAPLGSPVKATADGTVVRAGVAGGYGNMVEIQHSDGTTSRYAHLHAFRTSVGRPVKQGQVVGLVGSTGQSTGPHLHFEIRKNGSPVDPLGVLGGSAATIPAAEAANATEPIAGPGNTLAVPGPGGQVSSQGVPTMAMNPFVGSPLFGLAQMFGFMAGAPMPGMMGVKPIIINRTRTIRRAPAGGASIVPIVATSLFGAMMRAF